MPGDDFNNRVRVNIYELFVDRGRCPSLEELSCELNCNLSEVMAAAQELADAHMLVLQPGTGEILMASPLSAVPSPFLVETYEQSGVARTWYGNCIWDGLGVIAMLHTEGRVITSCGCCGEGMK